MLRAGPQSTASRFPVPKCVHSERILVVPADHLPERPRAEPHGLRRAMATKHDHYRISLPESTTDSRENRHQPSPWPRLWVDIRHTVVSGQSCSTPPSCATACTEQIAFSIVG